MGIALTVALLWWVLRDVALRDVWREITAARFGWLLAAAATATLTFPLRTIRWRYLLRSEGAVLPLGALWHATAIGFMANNLLPARAGEVVRAYAVRSLTGTRFTTAFASIAVERVFDGLFLVGLLVVGFAAGGFTTAATVEGMSLARAAWGGILLFGSAFLVALAVVLMPAPTRRIAHRVFHALLPDRWAVRALAMTDGLLDGLSALRSPKRLVPVLFWSLILWLTNAGSFVLAFVAFGLSLPWGAPLVLQGILAIGVALPSSPGFFGVFEGATKAALSLYGVSAVSTLSLAVGYHITGFLPITFLGLWSLWRADLRLKDLKKGQPSEMAGSTG